MEGKIIGGKNSQGLKGQGLGKIIYIDTETVKDWIVFRRGIINHDLSSSRNEGAWLESDITTWDSILGMFRE